MSGLSLSRPTSTEIVVEWEVPSLVKAGGFLEYVVRYEPVSNQGARRNRQEVSSACTRSPCYVPVGDARVAIIGLDPATGYDVTVQPFNEEGESGPAVVRTGTYCTK